MPNTTITVTRDQLRILRTLVRSRSEFCQENIEARQDCEYREEYMELRELAETIEETVEPGLAIGE